jgi:hypothetical protein
MSATDIELPSQRTPTAQVEPSSQATHVEQARATAEVQAAVIVAQKVPRDMGRVRAEMTEACGKLRLAERSFYKVPNRGEGPTVHLARELASIYGNIDYGVRELRRDDNAGESELIAYAWDQQRNTRSTRSFIVPHARMANKRRQKLVDLGDIYLNNQNIGARAVRECIFTVLPTDFVEEAQDLCRRTLADGEGEPLEQRISKMIEAFGTKGVKPGQIEAKIGRPRSSWTAGDVAHLRIVYRSIEHEGLAVDDEFPPERVTVEAITGGES